jgi:ribosomal protein S18 acetylase RimI-like enzyme
MLPVRFEILPLRPFTLDEVVPILSGYETSEIYTVEKEETALQTRFDIRLVTLDAPYRANFVDDFRPEEMRRYLGLLAGGSAAGAYQQDRLIGLAIGEAFAEERTLRIWEFHVHPAARRMGVGRALMEYVIAKARRDGLEMLVLETQNTNVPAIRFYRSMGFTLEAIDRFSYFYWPGDADKTAFYMKRRL